MSDEASILEAEMVDGAVLVTFSDGRCALYPAELLYAAIDRAKMMDAVALSTEFDDEMGSPEGEEFEPWKRDRF